MNVKFFLDFLTMEKPILLSKQKIFIVSLSSLILLYFIFFPPPFLPPNIFTENDAEIAEQIYKDIHDITEKYEITGIELLKSLPVERLKKLKKELSRILEKTHLTRPCIQYALVATQDGYYPSYNAGGTVFLKAGEVWKYGKTINGENGRYMGGLPYPNLEFRIEFQGTEKQCLIIEKIKIYSYLLHAENIKRAKKTGTLPLFRPPGNRIDR